MFNDYTVKNRRLTPAERADDLITAKIFCRPVREMLLDPPFYPYFPKKHPFDITFDLNYK